jgi:hypothetical protein
MSNPRSGEAPDPDGQPPRRAREAAAANRLSRTTTEPPIGSASVRDPGHTADLLTELGLLPSLELLERYGEMAPDMPRVIVGWIDAHISHRLEQERLMARAREARRSRGQYLSAAIALTGLLCAAAVGVFGNPVVASIIAIASIGGPTTAVALARVAPLGRAPVGDLDEINR